MVACEAQMYVQWSLLFLPKNNGGRETTTGNTSALRRLLLWANFTQCAYLRTFVSTCSGKKSDPSIVILTK